MNILESIRAKGVAMRLEDGKIMVSPKEAITDEIRNLISSNRDFIIALLEEERNDPFVWALPPHLLWGTGKIRKTPCLAPMSACIPLTSVGAAGSAMADAENGTSQPQSLVPGMTHGIVFSGLLPMKKPKSSRKSSQKPTENHKSLFGDNPHA